MSQQEQQPGQRGRGQPGVQGQRVLRQMREEEGVQLHRQARCSLHTRRTHRSLRKVSGVGLQ